MPPPRLAEWILARSLPASQRESILGDLDEELAAIRVRRGRLGAAIWYWGQTALFVGGFTVERARGAVRGDSTEGPVTERQTTWGGMMEAWGRELQLAVRSLGRKPGFALTCIVTLALGVGASTAIFSVINGVMLRPLGFEEPDRIVWLSEWWKDQSVPGGSSMNPANFVDLRSSVAGLEHMSPYQGYSANASGGERPERVSGLRVGWEFLQALGVQPALGRGFLREDDEPDAPAVVILTHELWRDRYGSAPSLVGQDISLNAMPHTVVGILPSGFDFPGLPRILTPLGFEGQEHSRGGRSLNGIARIAPGATLDEVQEQLTGAYARLEEAYADQNDNWSAWASPLQELAVRRSHRDALSLLGWTVGLVLLIAGLNVANLLLVRAETRQREMAVRVALGAGRARLLPHFLSEALVLSLAGGAVGVLVAQLGVQAIKAAYGSMLPRPEEIGVDATVLLFALGVSLGAGVVAGLVPLARSKLKNLQAELKDGARGSSGTGSRLRQSLVVGELALAVVLLATAGLLINSFVRVAGIDVGIDDPERVLVAQLSLPEGHYSEAADRVQFVDALMAEVETLPGVESVGLTSRLPLYGGTNFTRVPVLGDPERFSTFVEWRVVTPGFFDAVGVRLEEGRSLDIQDTAPDTVRSLVITRELATQLFPGESAVGRRIDPFDDDVGLEVVGVVSDLRDLGHERPAPPGMYAPYGPSTAQSSVILLIRTSGNPLDLIAPLRATVRRADGDLPLFGTRTLEDVVEQRLGGRKFSIALLGVFAGIAVLLGAIGIYGVMSYAVAQRTREMGVRLALGAMRADVLGIVLKHGARLTLLGLMLGLVGAFGASRLVQNQLYQVGGADPLTYLSVSLVLAAVAVLACYVPARRASATSPLEALRHE